MKLPRSIIKKYGITRKAWSIFRGQKSSVRHKSKRRGGSMARRKHFFGGRKSSVKPEMLALCGAGWGALRPMASNALGNIVPQGSLGGYADEAIFGLGGYLLAKKGRGLMKHAGLAVLTVEAASAGSGLSSGMGGQSQQIGSTGWY